MFLEIHLILVILSDNNDTNNLPNLNDDLKNFPGSYSFGKWKYIVEKKRFECHAAYMQCFSGKYHNYFVKHNILHRSNTIGCENVAPCAFKETSEEITDPLCANLYNMILFNKRNMEQDEINKQN